MTEVLNVLGAFFAVVCATFAYLTHRNLQKDINKAENVFKEGRHSFIFFGMGGLAYSLLYFADFALRVENAMKYAGVTLLILFSIATFLWWKATR